MSHFDYNAPVKYEAPPPRERQPFPRWILIVIGVIVGLAFIGYLLFTVYVGKMRTMLNSSLSPAAVHVGQPRQWRVLDDMKVSITSMGGAMGPMLCADFDADGDDEILRMGPVGGSKFYDVDGTAHPVKLQGMEYMMNSITWDYDRDGISEIVISESWKQMVRDAGRGKTSSQDAVDRDDYLLVIDLTGRQVARIKGSFILMDASTGDVNGDGFAELIVLDTDSTRGRRYLVYGASGKKSKSISGKYGIGEVIGDIDSDGLDEMITFDIRAGKLVVAGHDQPVVMLSGWPDIKSDSFNLSGALAATDINGDGFAEICSGYAGFYDAGTTSFTPFNHPVGFDDENMAIGESMAIGNFAADDNLEIAITHMMAGSIVIYNYSGDCVYYEDLGETTWAAACATSGGEDYLAVQLAERLLIYP